MKVIDTLDKSKAYRLKDLTLRQKTQIFEEVFGEKMKGIFPNNYFTGRNKNMPLWLDYTGHDWVVTAATTKNALDLRGHFSNKFKYNSKIIFVLW